MLRWCRGRTGTRCVHVAALGIWQVSCRWSIIVLNTSSCSGRCGVVGLTSGVVVGSVGVEGLNIGFLKDDQVLLGCIISLFFPFFTLTSTYWSLLFQAHNTFFLLIFCDTHQGCQVLHYYPYVMVINLNVFIACSIVCNLIIILRPFTHFITNTSSATLELNILFIAYFHWLKVCSCQL